MSSVPVNISNNDEFNFIKKFSEDLYRKDEDKNIVNNVHEFNTKSVEEAKQDGNGPWVYTIILNLNYNIILLSFCLLI